MFRVPRQLRSIYVSLFVFGEMQPPPPEQFWSEFEEESAQARSQAKNRDGIHISAPIGQSHVKYRLSGSSVVAKFIQQGKGKGTQGILR